MSAPPGADWADDTSMTVRAALTVAASQEEEEWSLGKRLVHRHRLVMQALERDEEERAAELERLRAMERRVLLLTWWPHPGAVAAAFVLGLTLEEACDQASEVHIRPFLTSEGSQ